MQKSLHKTAKIRVKNCSVSHFLQEPNVEISKNYFVLSQGSVSYFDTKSSVPLAVK